MRSCSLLALCVLAGCGHASEIQRALGVLERGADALGAAAASACAELADTKAEKPCEQIEQLDPQVDAAIEAAKALAEKAK